MFPVDRGWGAGRLLDTQNPSHVGKIVNELALATIYCVLMLGGETEVRHDFSVGDGTARIRVDCETDTQVIEVGWDRRSALDSVQQALFAASLTGKDPAVMLIDTDGHIGPFETRVRTAAAMSDVAFQVVSRDFLIRWQMTQWMRQDRRFQ